MRIQVLVLAAILHTTLTTPYDAQEAPDDSSDMQAFMEARNFDKRAGSWFRTYHVDPITDSVLVHRWRTLPVNRSPSASPDPTGPVLTASCHKSPGAIVTIGLEGSGTTFNFPDAGPWIRYRIDDNPASEWLQLEGVLRGPHIVAFLDNSQSHEFVYQLVAASETIVVRLRVGRDGPEHDFFFLPHGFMSVYADCLVPYSPMDSGQR